MKNSKIKVLSLIIMVVSFLISGCNQLNTHGHSESENNMDKNEVVSDNDLNTVDDSGNVRETSEMAKNGTEVGYTYYFNIYSVQKTEDITSFSIRIGLANLSNEPVLVDDFCDFLSCVNLVGKNDIIIRGVVGTPNNKQFDTTESVLWYSHEVVFVGVSFSVPSSLINYDYDIVIDDSYVLIENFNINDSQYGSHDEQLFKHNLSCDDDFEVYYCNNANTYDTHIENQIWITIINRENEPVYIDERDFVCLLEYESDKSVSFSCIPIIDDPLYYILPNAYRGIVLYIEKANGQTELPSGSYSFVIKYKGNKIAEYKCQVN